MRIIRYLGDQNLDYRSLMQTRSDILVEGISIPLSKVVICAQTHSSKVHICTESDAGSGSADKPQIQVADGLITNVPNLFLLVRTADCTPVLIYNEMKGVVAAVHSGREGTRKNIVRNTIEIAQKDFNCTPDSMKVIVGAGICGQHYQVSDTIWNEFNQTLEQAGISIPESRYRMIDIRAVINAQLLQAGILREHITNIPECTYESSNYFSYRRDGTINRQINLIGVCNV